MRDKQPPRRKADSGRRLLAQRGVHKQGNASSDTVQSDFDRNSMLSSKEAASALLHLAEQPSSQLIEDIILMPAAGAF